MGWFTAAAGVVTGVYGASQQHKAGQQQRRASIIEARRVKQAARDRQIERRRRLANALSNQIATGAAQGINPSVGSARALSLTDMRRAGLDEISDLAMTGRRVLRLRSAGQSAAEMGTAQASMTLVDTAGNLARSG